VTKLEVCVSNLDLGSEAVWAAIQTEFPNVKLRRFGCLGYCHRCIHHPYVLLDNHEFIEADTTAELLNLVRSYLHAKAE